MTKPVTPVRFGNQHSTVSNLGSSKANHSRCPQRISIHDILRDDSLQVRQRVDPRTVHKYAEAMRADAEFPAVTLAHIDGSLYLVDGWHRINAALVNNQHLIWADVFEMTFDEARWYAAKANTEHGLPLKTKELREVFRAFIETNQHMQGQRLMPYREIAKWIGKGYSTVRNWIRADYPRLFEKYQQMANSAPNETDIDREAKAMERRLTKAEADLHNVRNTGRTLDPENLGKLIYTLRETLSDLETNPYEPVRFVTDF
jgi:transposase